jgi:hypothetical protein
MGALLAREVKERAARLGIPCATGGEDPRDGHRRVAIYDSSQRQHDFYRPALDAVPVANIPGVAPEFSLSDERIDPSAVADASRAR